MLIVEDDDALREVMADYCRAEGWDVREAGDGRAGLDACASFVPDVVVLDLIMPRLDGWGFLKQSRADPRLRKVPVVVVTGSVVEDPNALGAALLVPKPFDLDDLGAALHGVIASGAR